MWRTRPAANKTFPEFCVYFTAKNKDRLRKLTTSQAGFHGANAAIAAVTTSPSAAAKPVTLMSSQHTAIVTTNDGSSMYYCWTHGLGFNKTHTSATCSNPATGHCLDATVKNMQGGNTNIMSNRRRPKSDTQKPSTTKPVETTTK